MLNVLFNFFFSFNKKKFTLINANGIIVITAIVIQNSLVNNIELKGILGKRPIVTIGIY